jgi:hypothetical protein
MRLITVLSVAAVFVLARVQVADADQPTVQPTTVPSAQPSSQLSDQEIRDLLVGNKYTTGWREGMRLTIEVHPNGTLHGYVSEGFVPSRYGAARNEDDGKYSIGDGKFCVNFGGFWANSNGKASCNAITRTDKGYYWGTKPILVIQAKS